MPQSLGQFERTTFFANLFPYSFSLPSYLFGIPVKNNEVSVSKQVQLVWHVTGHSEDAAGHLLAVFLPIYLQVFFFVWSLKVNFASES
jgi:hypothetical protein